MFCSDPHTLRPFHPSLPLPPQVFAITDSSKEDLQNVVDYYLGKFNGTGKRPFPSQ